MTISRVVEMEGPMMAPQDLLPDASREQIDAHRDWLAPHFLAQDGTLIISIQTFVIRTPRHTVLVDTCVGNDKPREAPAWHMRRGPFLQDLAAAGVRPEDVDVVLCTHLHIDHVGWNTRLQDGRWVPSFPNARYLITREEWAYWNDGNGQPFNRPTIEDSVLPVIAAGQAVFVDGDYVLDDGIHLESTPGHTPGHVIVHLKEKEETAILAGDIMHHPVQAAEPDWSAEYLDVDPAWARKTRLDFLERYTDADVLILGAHFAAPTAGYLVSHHDSRRFVPR